MKTILVILALVGLCALAYAADTSEVVNKTLAVAKVRVIEVRLNFENEYAAVTCSLVNAAGAEVKRVQVMDSSSEWNKWGGSLVNMGKRAMTLCRAQEGLQ